MHGTNEYGLCTKFRGYELLHGCIMLLSVSLSQVYMRRINSVAPNSREAEDPLLRRGKRSQSPIMEARGVGKTMPHAPVTAQSWGRSYTQQPQVGQQTLKIFFAHTRFVLLK